MFGLKKKNMKFKCRGRFGIRTKLFGFTIAISLVLFIFVLTSDTFHAVKSEYYRYIHGFIGAEVNVSLWTVNKYTTCDGNFIGYGHQFAVLKNVIIRTSDPKFYIPCDESQYSRLRYSFDFGKEGTHLSNWLKNVVRIHSNEVAKLENQQRKISEINSEDGAENLKTKKRSANKIVIAVQRYEYANLYHTMTDWYSVFLVTKLLNISMDDVRVLLWGKNISGPLDLIWGTLFKDVLYSGEITTPTLFPNMVWNILGYESPMNYHSRTHLPFVEQFHDFMLQRHGAPTTKGLNCDKLTILFLFRRDYVSHAGNKEGVISRKIQNEDELLNIVKSYYPTADVRGEQLDQLTFTQQLQMIAQTDILISMHGAGLSHVLFLPIHAGVLELYPIYWKKFISTNHFHMFAHWRGLKYASWQNYNPNNEYANFYTYVPPAVVEQRVADLFHQMCN